MNQTLHVDGSSVTDGTTYKSRLDRTDLYVPRPSGEPKWQLPAISNVVEGGPQTAPDTASGRVKLATLAELGTNKPLCAGRTKTSVYNY